MLHCDVAIYLDADILVQANVLQLLGPLAMRCSSFRIITVPPYPPLSSNRLLVSGNRVLTKRVSFDGEVSRWKKVHLHAKRCRNLRKGLSGLGGC